MKNSRIFIVLCLAAALASGCKKTPNPPPGEMNDSTAMTVPVDTAKQNMERWKAFRADANLRLHALQDSLDMYDARMKAANPHYKVDMKRRADINRRAAALQTTLAAEPKDEAVGSFGRMKDAIVGGLDTMATGVAGIVSPKKKK